MGGGGVVSSGYGDARRETDDLVLYGSASPVVLEYIASGAVATPRADTGIPTLRMAVLVAVLIRVVEISAGHVVSLVGDDDKPSDGELQRSAIWSCFGDIGHTDQGARNEAGTILAALLLRYNNRGADSGL